MSSYHPVSFQGSPFIVLRCPLSSARDRFAYHVYEPSSEGSILEVARRHTTFSHVEAHGGWLGRVTSRAVPDAIDAIPPSPARTEALRNFREANAELSRRVIDAAFPGILTTHRAEWLGDSLWAYA